jgi:putative ABC transport system substrate-binding protein
MMSFGVDFRVLFRRSATYVDKILRGTKPGELPIEQPTRFELALNQKTARALGVAIPQSVLVRADRIIE